MRKLLLVLVLGALVGAGWWAWQRFVHVASPEEAFLATMARASLGDEEGFVQGFTEDARPIVAGVLALSRGENPHRDRNHPYYYLVTENIDEVRVTGDQAWVRVRRAGVRTTSAVYDVPMRLEGGSSLLGFHFGGSWRIDGLAFTARKLDPAELAPEGGAG